MFELTFLTAGPTSQTLVVALYYAVFAAGVRAVQSIDAMAVIYMVTTLVWLVDRAALRQPDADRHPRQAGACPLNRLSRKTLVAGFRRTSRARGYDPAETRVGHRASRHRRLPSRAPGRLRRRSCSRPVRPAGRSAARACARPIRAMRSTRRTASIRSRCAPATASALRVDRRGAAGDRRAAGSAAAARRHVPIRRAHRQPDRDREGLLPRSGDRDPATRTIPTSSPISQHPHAPRIARPVSSSRRCDAGAPRRRAFHGAVLRQPSVQRPHGRAGRRRASPRCATAISAAFVEPRGRVPLDDGRPDRAGDDRCGPGARSSTALGVEDAWPVMTEPFTQWVIEDRFADRAAALRGGRRGAGRRRRALRADEAPAPQRQPFHPRLSRLSRRLRDRRRRHGRSALSRDSSRALMDEEVTPTLAHAAGRRSRGLQARAARALRATRRSSTAPGRSPWTGRRNCRSGCSARSATASRPARRSPRLALGVAAWMRYVTGIDEKGRPIDVRDPMSARLRSIADEAGPVAERLAPALLGVQEVFGDLAQDPRFTKPVTEALGRLFQNGSAQNGRGAPGLIVRVDRIRPTRRSIVARSSRRRSATARTRCRRSRDPPIWCARPRPRSAPSRRSPGPCPRSTRRRERRRN